ncbi:MAG: hypothetical protein EON92_01310 [Burkholderiales bacterium]|nr:MAG: hypothetical protein EON92_01310 [Burkholderiales bacterium]
MVGLKHTMMRAFDVRDVEVLPLALLLAHSFFKGVSFVFFETPANTLFLAELDVKLMPWIYVATALVTAILGLVYSWLETRVSPGQLLISTLAFLLASGLILYLALVAGASAWIAMALMVWKDVVYILGGLEFWALAGILFNVRQGKRLFGLVGAGEVVAIVVGGLSVPWMVKAIGTPALLLVACVGFAASIAVLLRALPLLEAQAAGHPQHPAPKFEAASVDHRSWAVIFRDRYLRILLAASVLSYFCYYLVDYMFYDQVKANFQDEAKIAGFFGIFYAVLGMLQLVTGAIAAGPLMQRFGVAFGLLALPVACALGAGTLAAFALAGAASACVLWITVSTKIADEVLRVGLEGPAYRILYQPLPDIQRMRVMALRESIVDPLAMGLSGLGLLALTSLLGFGVRELALVLLGALAVWIALCIMLRSEYKSVLIKALGRRSLGGGKIALNDSASQSMLLSRLDSPRAAEAIFCATTLEEARYRDMPGVLARLLQHPQMAVQLHAISRIEAKVSTDPVLIEALRGLMAQQGDATLRGAALRALCAALEAGAFVETVSFLDDDSAQVRHAAIVGLLRHGGINGVLAAGERFQTLMCTADPAARSQAATLLGAVSVRSFYQPLVALLADSDVGVRRSALQAAGALQAPQLVKEMVRAVDDPATRSAAAAALRNFGAGALPAMRTAFDQPGAPLDTRVQLTKVAARIDDEDSREWLRNVLADDDLVVSDQALAGLVSQGWRASEVEAPDIRALLRSALVDAALITASLIDVGDLDPVTAAIWDQFAQCRSRVLMLLALLHQPEIVMRVRATLLNGAPKQRANALEALDSLLPTQGKGALLALLDELTPAELRERLPAQDRAPLLGKHGRLREIATRKGAAPWLKACTLYAIGRAAGTSASLDIPDTEVFAPAGTSQDAMVRETAHWARRRLAGEL